MKHTYCKIVSQAVSLSRACIETHYTANTERPREKVMRGYLLVECAFIRVCISIVTVARNRDNRNTTKNKPPLTGSLSWPVYSGRPRQFFPSTGSVAATPWNKTSINKHTVNRNVKYRIYHRPSLSLCVCRACIETHYNCLYSQHRKRPQEKVMRGYLLAECASARWRLQEREGGKGSCCCWL